jgi:hypothetical protein
MILQNVFRPWRSLVYATLAGVAFVSTGFAQGDASFGLAPAAKPKSQATKLQEYSEQLKQAEGADARKEALAKLSSVVNEIFDADLKRRKSEVDDIRVRVSKLKALIDKRKKSKDRIVDLQFRIQVNEAAGLGFSLKQKSRRKTPYAGMMTMMAMMQTAGSLGDSPDAGIGSPRATGYREMTGIAKPVDPRGKAERTLRAVMVKLKEAKEGEDRQAWIKELKPALEAYFAADLNVREQEIAGIQSRVENLDKQIERRRSARDEIISLQLEVLTNEADGLGFFSTSATGSARLQIYRRGQMTAPGGAGGGGGGGAGRSNGFGGGRSGLGR